MKPKKGIPAETKPSDAETAGLKGPVNMVQYATFKAHLRGGAVIAGKMEGGYSFYRKQFITTYDEKGHKTEEQLFGSEGKNTTVFNEMGLPTEVIHSDKEGNLLQKTTSAYDDKGNLLESITRNPHGGITNRIAASYRDDGRLIERTYYLTRGQEEIVSIRTVHEYDERGNEISVTQHGLDPATQYRVLILTQRTEFKFNEKNQRIEYLAEHFGKESGNLYISRTYKFNEQGDVTEQNTYNRDGSLKHSFSFTHEYDSHGKKIIPPPPPPYDPDAKTEAETEEVETDAHDNWIKKTTFYDKMPINMVLREISYFGEPSKSPERFIHPFTMTTDVENTPEPSAELTAEQAQWLVEAPNSASESFPALRYYTLLNKEAPSLLVYTGPYIEAFALLHELKENMGAQEIHSYSTVWSDHGEQLMRYTLGFPRNGYLLQANHISRNDEDEFEVPGNIKNRTTHNHHDGYVYTSQFQLLRPSLASGKRNEEFEEELDEYIRKCSLKKKPDKPVINMIEVTAGGFAMQEHPVNDDFEIKDLDVNYGSGFEKFHTDLMQRFSNSTKGLVLFHGQPGTGKTYYIRHLLRKMVSSKKVVIYMPPNMVDHLTEPSFMTFLSNAVQEWSDDGNFCVLLIEDAEPLLAKRQEGVRIQGVTNLLNMTDGLLNDMLNLQIICTFNVDLRKLDSALLRPGRLIARKEFKALSELDANLLAQRLGIKHHFTKSATLGEIYSLRKNQNTLIHDVEPDRNASKPIDDF